jgi:hypothetical protein
MLPFKYSYNTEPVMPLLVAKFKNLMPNMSIQSVLHLISVKRFYNTELVMSTLVAKFKNLTLNLFIQSVLHLISAKQDVLGPNHNKSKETKIGLKDKGVKASKKQKIR